MIGSSMIDRKAEGEVEVTVIKRAIPSDADLVPAHQTGQRTWIEGFISRGYYPPAALQDASASIHGKPVTDLLAKWFKLILNQ